MKTDDSGKDNYEEIERHHTNFIILPWILRLSQKTRSTFVTRLISAVSRLIYQKTKTPSLILRNRALMIGP